MRGLAAIALLIVVTGCAPKKDGAGLQAEAPPPATFKGALATRPAAGAAMPAAALGDATSLDTGAIEEAIGLTGAVVGDGVFRITKPRGDLKVALDGFAITPRMGLAGWVAFRSHASGAFLLGVMPATTDELPAVVSALANAGLEITAIHAHFAGEEPRIAFLHFGGVGNAVALARGVRDVLDAIVRVRAARPLKPRTGEASSALEAARLDAILGLHGEHDGGVYRVSAPRTDLRIREMDVDLGPILAPASYAALQGTHEHAAVAGELIVLPSEAQAVIHALREARIGVVGVSDVSSRMDPRVVGVSFWGVGRAEALATGVRRALDQLSRGG
jgi:hypothetical protein